MSSRILFLYECQRIQQSSQLHFQLFQCYNNTFAKYFSYLFDAVGGFHEESKPVYIVLSSQLYQYAQYYQFSTNSASVQLLCVDNEEQCKEKLSPIVSLNTVDKIYLMDDHLRKFGVEKFLNSNLDSKSLNVAALYAIYPQLDELDVIRRTIEEKVPSFQSFGLKHYIRSVTGICINPLRTVYENFGKEYTVCISKFIENPLFDPSPNNSDKNPALIKVFN